METMAQQGSKKIIFMPINGREFADKVARALEQATGNSYAHCLQEAWVIIETALSTTKTILLGVDHALITMEMHEDVWHMVHERVEQKKPLQYLAKTAAFCGVNLQLQPPIFIPRPETEEWCLRLIEILQPHALKNLIILEIGVGSGAISVALAHAFPHFRIIGVDINFDAIALAERNKVINNCPNVLFITSDVYSSLGEGHQFDLIVSNPPYVTADEWATMDEGITMWEDKRAFVADDNGLAVYMKIFEKADAFLRLLDDAQPNVPRLVLEIGATQAADVMQLARNKGYKPTCFKDYAGKDRMILCE